LSEWGAPERVAGWFNIRNPFALAPFTALDALQVGLLRRSSNMQLIARKPR
jgi:hypothetical protein